MKGMPNNTGYMLVSGSWEMPDEWVSYIAGMGLSLLAAVPTGEEAIRLIDGLSPDIVVLDIALAGDLDGIETAKRIGERRGPAIIFMSDECGEDHLVRACETEHYGFLVRPISREILLSTMIMAWCRRKSETRLMEIANSVPDVIYEVDGNGNIVFLSRNIGEVFGYDPGEMRTVADVFRVIAPEDRERAAANYMKTAGGTPGREVEYTALKNDGTRIPISIIALPVMENGACIGSRGVVRNIADRVEERRKLEESEYKYRTLVENINDVHAILDMDGTITYISPSIERVSLYGVNELTGRNFMEFVYEEDLPALLEMHKRTLAGTRKPDEYRLVDKDGRVVWVRTSSSLIMRDGRPAGISSLITDISEKRRLEEEIIHISEKERTRIGQDLHDGIGQYFTGLGYLFRTLIDMVPRKSKKITAAATEITGLISDAKKHVQMLSKGYYPVGMDSRGIIAAITELCSNIEHMYSIACTFVYGEDVEIHDNDTAIHIYYIINEAVNNAIKHGKAKNILIMMKRDEGRMFISIEDDGTGFDTGADTADGLGLSIMKHRASIIGGTLKIQPGTPGGIMVACMFKPG